MTLMQTWREFQALFPKLADRAKRITSVGVNKLRIETSRDIISERNGAKIRVTETLLVIFSYTDSTHWTLETVH